MYIETIQSNLSSHIIQQDNSMQQAFQMIQAPSSTQNTNQSALSAFFQIPSPQNITVNNIPLAGKINRQTADFGKQFS